MSRKKVKNREYQEHDLSRQKENEIRLYLSEKRKERDKRKDEFEKLILKLTKKYDDFDETRRPSEVFDDAGVVDNILRRIRSDENYYGPDKIGCILIGLAIGCDNIEDIDSILLVRGYEPLANALGYENIQIRDVVEKILAGEEIPRKDRATIFGNSCC